MSMSFPVEAPPLRTDADGVVRVANTRVPLDTVIAAFAAGATAEEISQQFPSLPLADVYQVIAYYLRRPGEVEDYLRRRRAESATARVSNEQRFDPSGVRARLLARVKAVLRCPECSSLHTTHPSAWQSKKFC